MPFKSNVQLTAILILAVSLSSCIATKSYEEPDPQVETENLYPYDQVAMDSTTLADMPWDELFKDRHLQQLIQEGLQNNTDLQQAIQQIRVAEANFFQGRMNLFPSLSAGGSASYIEQSDNSISLGGGSGMIPASDRYSVSLSSSWEMDVWGKLTSAKKASYAALLQSEATRRAVQTTLIANIANSYYRLMALDRQLQITRETVENRKEDLATVRSLKESSVVTEAAVQQSMANLYAAEIAIPEINQQITELENGLSILLGREAGEISRNSLDQQEPIHSLATGLPGQLLNNRPDILAAEYAFRSSFETTNNARTYFYPSFTLTAEGGYQSLDTQDLFKPGSLFYNLVGGLTQPIFDRGQNKARLKRARARQEQALLSFRQTILEAGGEVSDALSKYENAEQKRELRSQQLEALENAVEYSRELLQYGEATYTDVLTAQQSLLSAQIAGVNDRLQQLTAGVELYRALGGGWNKAIDSEQETAGD